MNVLFSFWTFRSIFEFLATYETTFDPKKAKKTRKSNETFEKWTKRSFYSEKMNVENETFISTERKWT